MPDILDTNEIFFTPFEPKTKNRFIMYIEGIPSYLVKAAARPQIQFEEMVLDHINVKRHLKGKGTWQPVDITLYDPIVPSGAQAVMEWVRLGHESVTGRDGYADFYKKDITIPMRLPLSMEYDILPKMNLFYKILKSDRFDIGTPERLNKLRNHFQPKDSR